MDLSRPTAEQKAFKINMDASKHGTFAEIGAGQEVVRWFFHAGGASGTVAKTISAYDMQVSDAIYGSTDRYVSRQRLEAMLDHEYGLLVERLGGSTGGRLTFFVFANTMATRSFSYHRDGHGWLGIRFQHTPQAPPSQITLHSWVFDKENSREQEAIGILGVNLIYGAFYHQAEPEVLIGSLLDGLGQDRIEVDMIEFSGPCFADVDNRLMSLQLVEQQLSEAAMFTATGANIQPSDVLHEQSVLVLRGNFRPITKTAVGMLEEARDKFYKEEQNPGGQPVTVLEMTLNSLIEDDRVDHEDFLQRVDILRPLDQTVVISNLGHYYSLVQFLRRHTSGPILFALGIPALRLLFEKKYYAELSGGILEGMGRLFSGDVRLYVHPYRETEDSIPVDLQTVKITSTHHHLFRQLIQDRRIRGIAAVDEKQLHVLPSDVLKLIQSGDPSWTGLVPEPVAKLIRQRELFGYHPMRR